MFLVLVLATSILVEILLSSPMLLVVLAFYRENSQPVSPFVFPLAYVGRPIPTVTKVASMASGEQLRATKNNAAVYDCSTVLNPHSANESPKKKSKQQG